jgi:multiple antibiotic resistance protein
MPLITATFSPGGYQNAYLLSLFFVALHLIISVMLFDLREIGSATMILFAVIDILGGLPVLIDLENRLGDIHELKVTIVSGAIMLVFLFLGQSILSLIGLDIRSFAIAGAIVIFFLGIEMVLGIKLNKDETSASASIVPVAFPLIAGTGTLTTLLTIRAEFKIENIIVAILINLVIVYIVIKNIKHLARLLGPGGISILRKVFGITLLAIAIKIFTANLGTIH